MINENYTRINELFYFGYKVYMKKLKYYKNITGTLQLRNILPKVLKK